MNYTVDTLRHFHEEEPERELFFLMGADMFWTCPIGARPPECASWPCRWLFAGPAAGPIDFDCLRGIASAERIEAIRRHQIEMPEIGTSGTDLRRRVLLGQSIRYRVPPAVEMYIQTHGLYR